MTTPAHLTPPPSARREPVAVALGLAVLVLVMGLWPWQPVVHLFPHGSDATKWVIESHPSQKGWFEYVFFTRHFIGYRPVAALSFTLSGAVGGFEPWAYRLVDIVLHGTVGVLLLGAYRALTGDRSAWGLLAPLVFFLHPATEDVVPFLARRSYSLSCALALGGLIAFARTARRSAADRPFGASTWLATLLLGMALLSNEVAGIVVVMLPLIALHLRPPGPEPRLRALLPTLPAFAVTAAVVAMRWWVIGHQGGYHKRYFAYTRNGRNMLSEVGDTPYQQILEAAWRYAFFPTSARGADALWLGGTVTAIVALTVTLTYAWLALVRPALERRDPEGRLPLLLMAWLLAYTLLYAATRNWFWRQAYPMLLPLSLLFAVLARRTWTRTAGRPVTRVLLLLPQLALLASVGFHSPVIRGIDSPTLVLSTRASTLVHEVRRTLVDVEEPAQVWLALPGRGSAAHAVRTWSKQIHKDQRITFKVLATGGSRSSVGLEDSTLVLDDGARPKITLAKGMAWADGTQARLKLEPDAKDVWLDALHSNKVNGYVYWRDGGRGVLTPVPAPSRKKARRARGGAAEEEEEAPEGEDQRSR